MHKSNKWLQLQYKNVNHQKKNLMIAKQKLKMPFQITLIKFQLN